ncbi:hypothetical protein AEB_P2539 [Altererythrobacter sp. B11]|nr:hypothetical protein AEB_P2539 [Altererythrobacter sp. B11]
MTSASVSSSNGWRRSTPLISQPQAPEIGSTVIRRNSGIGNPATMVPAALLPAGERVFVSIVILVLLSGRNPIVGPGTVPFRSSA